jgi:hypothetical protein
MKKLAANDNFISSALQLLADFGVTSRRTQADSKNAPRYVCGKRRKAAKTC